MKYLFYISLTCFLLCSCGRDENLTFQTEQYSNTAGNNCSEIRLELPKAGENRKIGKTINNALKEEVISILAYDDELSASTIQEAIASFDNGFNDLRRMFPDETIPWEAKIEGEIFFENKELLTIGLRSYIFTGGAHGYGSTRFLNFDKNSGEELERNEIFKNRDQFEEFVEMKFRLQESIPNEGPINSTGFMFERNVFYLPENIGFTEEGLKLLYNPYEVASYADGVIELTLPYSEVKEFLAFGI